MSFRHIEELNVVRDEFDAVRGAMTYVRDVWSEAGHSLAPVKLYDLTAAMHRLEATYIVRLTAGYEAIVYDALRRSSGRKVDDKASGVELTNLLSSWLQERVKSSAPTSRPGPSDQSKIADIKARAAEIRRVLSYRNQIAHRKPPREQEFSFLSARTALNLLLDIIP